MYTNLAVRQNKLLNDLCLYWLVFGSVRIGSIRFYYIKLVRWCLIVSNFIQLSLFQAKVYKCSLNL